MNSHKYSLIQHRSFILQLFFFVHVLNCQVGVVSQSAKPEDPRLRRRRHGETLFPHDLLLFHIFYCVSPQRILSVCLSVGGVDPVHSR